MESSVPREGCDMKKMSPPKCLPITDYLFGYEFGGLDIYLVIYVRNNPKISNTDFYDYLDFLQQPNNVRLFLFYHIQL